MNQKMSFEQALARLQEITEKLESGEEGLDASMKLFEEGAKLTVFCRKKLESGTAQRGFPCGGGCGKSRGGALRL